MIDVEMVDAEEDNLSKFVQNLRHQMNSIAVHAPKPSGRVGFVSGDFEDRPHYINTKPRRVSDISMNDIMKQKTARLDEFLSTR